MVKKNSKVEKEIVKHEEVRQVMQCGFCGMDVQDGIGMCAACTVKLKYLLEKTLDIKALLDGIQLLTGKHNYQIAVQKDGE